ncbi:sphingosine-1-phosphate phosphatase 2 [Cotesia typhae]|uniref:sphingosine-1-phosphate phosphatase 2 n=1 Tax=Cotesia typhae TaxID=2053667 RepID=UPI003D69F97F
MDVINYLKDAELVAKIQKFFGVYYSEIVVDKNGETSGLCPKNGSRKNKNGCLSINNSNLCHNHRSNQSGKAQVNSTDCNCDDNNEITKVKAKEFKSPIISNYYWYYLFLFSTQLGDEIFYTTFIPFLFWNIDAVVARRVILVWGIIMTIGQILKDIIRWPRPECPPAIRLQKKWSQEYGMPSTHAAIGVAIPFSIIIFTINRYNYSVPLGLIFVTTWCTLICISRLYLGMHTILDIVAGLLLAVVLMVVLIPIISLIDIYLFTNLWILLTFLIISVLTIVYYPCSDRWTPTRGDTAMVVSVTAGIHFGAWLNYKTGLLIPALESPPYEIILPSCWGLLCIFLRFIIGFSCIIPNKAIIKHITYRVVSAIMHLDSQALINSENSLENRAKIICDLTYKFLFCFLFGVLTVYFLPQFFALIGLERKEFYTEFL